MTIEKYNVTDDFSSATLAALLASPTLLARLASVITPERFESPHVQVLVRHIVAFFKSYNTVPTSVELLQRVKEDVVAGTTEAGAVAACAQLLERGFDLPPVTPDAVFDAIVNVERHIRFTAGIDDALRTSLRLRRYTDIIAALQRAEQTGRYDQSPAVDYIASLDARTDVRQQPQVNNRWGIGVNKLDDALQGGLAPGELGCFLAPPKHGKSQALGFVAQTTLAAGGNVFYASLEMSEQSIVDRLDASISRVLISALRDRAGYVRDRVRNFFANTGGVLRIKQFAPGSTTVGQIENYMKMLQVEHGFRPSVLVVDYGDLIGSESAKESRFRDLGQVYTDLRRVAVDWQIPVWTASQTKRDSMEKKNITIADIAESFQKVAVADVVVAICGTDEEKVAGLIRFFIAACRYATSHIELGPYQHGFAMGRLVLSQEQALEDESLI